MERYVETIFEFKGTFLFLYSLIFFKMNTQILSSR